MIDVNVTTHRYPFRRLYGDDPATLVSSLRGNGVTRACVGSFDGLLHHDLSAVNARLASDCARHGPDFLTAFGSVNPGLPGWQEDLRRCHETHRMRGIRLNPNYHGYTLADPACLELLSAAARRNLIVQIVVAVEDERTQHPLLRVAPVDLAPLPQISGNEPRLRIVVLNAARTARVRELSAAGGIWLDIAMVEGVGGVADFFHEAKPDRILFGSHFPFFYFEAAALKVKEAGLPANDSQAITNQNARALLQLSHA